MPKNTPAPPSGLAAALLPLGKHAWAGHVAGWLLGAVVLAYAVWFLGFATVHDGPLVSVPSRTLASDRSFDDLPAMLEPLGAAPARLVSRSGIGKPTTWLMAELPAGNAGAARTLHFTEKSISRGEAAILNRDGRIVMRSTFGIALTPQGARRALPGYAIDIPGTWNSRDGLKLVMRLEPSAVANGIGIDVWDAKGFQDGQFKLQQRKTMLIGALLLLTVYALAAAQAGKVFYLLVFAFWLVARCAFVIGSGGFGFFSFGEAAGSSLGLGLRQVALLSFPCAVALLVWTLTRSELGATLATRLLKMAVAVSCAAMVVGGFLPSAAFQVVLWTTGFLVIATVMIVIQRSLRSLDDATTRWTMSALLIDIGAGVNELFQSLGFVSLLPWLDLEQVSLLSAMLTGVAVGSMVAKERAQRLQAQESAIEALGKYEAVYRTVPIGLISFGPGDRVERFNDGFAEMFGLPRGGDAASGIDPLSALDLVFPAALRDRIREELRVPGECDFAYHVGDESHGRWLRILARGTPASFEASVTDITEHKNTERRLSHAVEHDGLTGALNRRGLGRRIARALDGSSTDPISLIYLDLDRFKLLNDLFGHHAGDTVLQDVVTRMRAALGEEAAVARVGGDEFCALLESERPDRHEDLALAVLQAIAGEPFKIPTGSFTLTASVGLFRCAPGLSQEALIAAADRACLDAKRRGRNQVVVQGDLGALIQRQTAGLSMLADLEEADTFGDFVLTVQPVVSLQDPRRMGGEVLLNYRDADGHLQSAEHLREAAQERGDLPRLDRWILRHALTWLSRRDGASGSLDFLSLNLSAASLNDELFKAFVLALLHTHNRIAHLLVIEITERAAMQDLFVMAKFIAQVRDAGARVALDDFGTAYSSFASLTEVGAGYLKIDGKFVQALGTQDSNPRVIRTINVLAHELGMLCVATSVDDADVLPLLGPLGVDYAQGSALCTPLSLPAFEALCAAGSLEHATDAWRALHHEVAAGTPAVSAQRQPVSVG